MSYSLCFWLQFISRYRDSMSNSYFEILSSLLSNEIQITANTQTSANDDCHANNSDSFASPSRRALPTRLFTYQHYRHSSMRVTCSANCRRYRPNNHSMESNQLSRVSWRIVHACLWAELLSEQLFQFLYLEPYVLSPTPFSIFALLLSSWNMLHEGKYSS